jgi:intraflagellar transport protein 74
MKRGYVGRSDAIKQQVNMVSAQYEQKKRNLAENDTARDMETLENKLRHYEQNIFHLREFIAAKEHDTNYLALKDDCNRMIDDLNRRTIKTTAEAPMPQPTMSF